MKTQVDVSVRVRPFVQQIDGEWAEPCIDTYDQKHVLGDGKTFDFDNVFDESVSTTQMYKATFSEFVKSSLQGFNVTIFCYGQTSSGKTHTMLGSDEEPGIIPLAMDDLLQYIRDDKERKYLLQMSYMELYNEQLFDLLSGRNSVTLFSSASKELILKDLSRHAVRSFSDIKSNLKSGNRLKRVSENYKHSSSSRSHTIFRLEIESAPLEEYVKVVDVSTLCMVDLAGSEAAHENLSAERRAEGSSINKSLLFLRETISNLTQKRSCMFRNSKLTRLLESSLSGNAIVSLICNVCSMPQYVRESVNTLEFGCTAKQVGLHPRKNRQVEDTVLHRLQAEVLELREALGNSTGEREEFQRRIAEYESVVLSAESLRFELDVEHRLRAQKEEELERERAEKEEFARLLEKEEMKRHEYENKLQKIANESEELSHSKKDLEQSLVDAREANRNAQAQLIAKENDLEQLRKNNDELEKLRTEVEGRRLQALEEKDRMQGVLNDLMVQKRDLEEEVQKAKMKTASLNEEGGMLKDKVSALSEQLSSLVQLGPVIHTFIEEDFAAAERRLSSIREQKDTEISQLCQQLQELITENENLKKELEDKNMLVQYLSQNRFG